MKAALITGANRGLGLETARQLGRLGYAVLLGCRDAEKGTRAADQLRDEGLNASALALDVSEPDSIERAFADLATRIEALDALINNAAIYYDSWRTASAVDFAIVDEAWRTNVVGAWRVACAALSFLRRSRSPRIVNVSSEAALLKTMGGETPAYGVSKAALNALTIKLALELKREGILVNAVCPGWTATDTGGGGQPVPDGARGIVWAATLPDSGPSGGFFRDGRVWSGDPIVRARFLAGLLF